MVRQRTYEVLACDRTVWKRLRKKKKREEKAEMEPGMVGISSATA
jgi:hypothetical protein